MAVVRTGGGGVAFVDTWHARRTLPRYVLTTKIEAVYVLHS